MFAILKLVWRAVEFMRTALEIACLPVRGVTAGCAVQHFDMYIGIIGHLGFLLPARVLGVRLLLGCHRIKPQSHMRPTDSRRVSMMPMPTYEKPGRSEPFEYHMS